MYLVVIAVLSIVLTFPESPYAWVTPGVWTWPAVALATLLPAGVAWGVNRRALRLFEQRPAQPGDGQSALGRGMLLIQVLLALGQGGVLLLTDWMERCAGLAGTWLVVPGLLALTPFLGALVLVWVATFPADRAVRQLALEMYLFRSRPPRPAWTLGQYLQYNLRHQVLFILIPMVLILAARDVVVHYKEAIRTATGQEYGADLVLGVMAVGVAVIAPEILRHVWVTQRLPQGPLRDRLLVLCERLGLRCREILVWRSGGMIVNAAVMGVVAPLRYVLITDAMLEQLEDVKIEAVFGHEAGHVKRHHILYFLLFALISGCIVMIFTARTRGLGAAEYQVAAAVLGAVLLVKWGVLFGWISRRFERQADVFGVRTLAVAGLPCTLPCALHGTAGPHGSQAGGDPLCATAAHVFSHALNDVALLNGIRPEAHSWRHSSISSRSRLVQALARDPRRTQRFERLVLLIKGGILAGAVAGALWAAQEIGLFERLTRAGG